MRKRIVLIFITAFLLMSIYENVSAKDPVTVFYPICWELLRIPDVDKDYIRFHLGYWSSGGEEFQVSVTTKGGYAGWGSLHHDTTSLWKTVPGSVDDMVLTVYAEDTHYPDQSPVKITFLSKYHEDTLKLSVIEVDPCMSSWPSWNNYSEPEFLPLDTIINL